MGNQATAGELNNWLNNWQCEAAGCTSTAAGVGSARGLRALGWFVFAGGGGRLPFVKCPRHHPDGMAVAVQLAGVQQNRMAVL